MKNKRKQIQSSKILLLVAASLLIGCPKSSLAVTMSANEVESVMQKSIVKGTVVDTNGDPIIGATIRDRKSVV